MKIQNIKEGNREGAWKSLFTHVSDAVRLDGLKHTRAFWYSFFVIAFVFVAIIPLGIETAFAAGEGNVTQGNQGDLPIVLLEDYRGIQETLKNSGGSSDALAAYVNFIIKLAFGFGSIGAVILLIYGGIKYTTSESFQNKSDGKGEVSRAIGALLILFSGFIFFNTLNPELLKVRFKPLSADLQANSKIPSYNGSASAHARIDELTSLGYRPYISGCVFNPFINNRAGGRECSTKRIKFLRTEEADGMNVSECILDTRGGHLVPDRTCFFVIQKKDIGKINPGEYEAFLAVMQQAEAAGYNRSSYIIGKSACDSQANTNSASVYGQPIQCYCFNAIGGGAVVNKCAFFAKTEEQEGETYDQARINAENNNYKFQVEKNGGIWSTKSECQSIATSHSNVYSSNGNVCFYENEVILGRDEWVFFTRVRTTNTGITYREI